MRSEHGERSIMKPITTSRTRWGDEAALALRHQHAGLLAAASPHCEVGWHRDKEKKPRERRPAARISRRAGRCD